MNEFEIKIRWKEKEEHRLFVTHKDKTKTPYTHIGYRSEDAMLADFMTWAKNTYPDLRKAIFHIENEGDTSSPQARMRGAQSLAKGKLAGVFDVLSVYQGIARWAEFKLPGENLSDKQKELKALWVDTWLMPFVIIRTFDDWKRWIEFILLNLK